MNKKTAIIASGLILLIVTSGITWVLLRPDPKVERVKQLQQELFAGREEQDDEQRRQLREQYKQARDVLNGDQRKKSRQASYKFFQASMQDHMDTFFALDKTQRAAFLDKDIKRFETHRKQFEERRRERESKSSDAGGQNRRKDGPRGYNHNRDERLRRILDRTTPEMRAKFTAYMQALNERREELGLEPMRRPPFHRGSQVSPSRPRPNT